jgi:hypothetical protein
VGFESGWGCTILVRVWSKKDVTKYSKVCVL